MVMGYEYMETNRHWFIILTMLLFLTMGYFLLRRWNQHSRPKFLRALLILFSAQLVTIFALNSINFFWLFFSKAQNEMPDTMGVHLDATDFLIKTLLFALGLPLLVLSIAQLDRK